MRALALAGALLQSRGPAGVESFDFDPAGDSQLPDCRTRGACRLANRRQQCLDRGVLSGSWRPAAGLAGGGWPSIQPARVPWIPSRGTDAPRLAAYRTLGGK